MRIDWWGQAKQWRTWLFLAWTALRNRRFWSWVKRDVPKLLDEDYDPYADKD